MTNAISTAANLVILVACVGVLMALVAAYIALAIHNHNASPKLPGGKPDGWVRNPDARWGAPPFEPVYDEQSLDDSVAHCDRVKNDGVWNGWQACR